MKGAKKMDKLLVHIPHQLKLKLDEMRTRGYTSSGYIRHLIEQALAPDTEDLQPASKSKQKGGA